MSDEHMNQMT